MVSSFICGTFPHDQEEDMEPLSPPKRSRRNKNPYANLGLDKFSALLADLEEKRQKIFTEKGSDEISFIHFVYSDSNSCKPIVVKLKDKKEEKTKSKSTERQNQIEIQEQKTESDQKNKKKGFTCNLKLAHCRRAYYFLLIILSIMLLLVLFGRSFAILFLSVGWYSVPIIKRESSTSTRSNKKKDFARRLSDELAKST